MTEDRWWSLVPDNYHGRPEFSFVPDEPTLPRVLLLGDSISMSYTVSVQRLLTGLATVHRAPGNCRSTRHTLDELDHYLNDGQWQAIHCNWGIHDITQVESAGVQQVEIEEYERNLETLFERLAATGAALIWASTTPVQDGTPKRSPSDVVRYNRVATQAATVRGIAINDLYSLTASRMTDLQPLRNVHFTEAGAEVLAAQVTHCIRAALAAIETNTGETHE